MRRMTVRQNPSFDENGVKVYRFRAYEAVPLRQGLGVFSPEMLSHIKDSDLVHAHGYGRFPTLLALLSKPMKIPFVVTTHSDAGSPSLRKTVFDAVVPSLTIRRANMLIALTKHEKRVLESRGASPSSIKVIPNGVDLAEFESAEARPRSSLYKTVLFVGRIDFEQKGVDLLLAALSNIVHRRGMKVRLRLVGPDWGDLEAAVLLAKQLNIGQSVEFLGAMPQGELVREMRSADALVLPSRFEPFGIVVLEAMAAGLPVVAARVGGIPELVTDGFNGMLFDRGSAESLSSKLQFLLENEDYGEVLARNASSGLNRFAWPNIARETLQTYNDVRKNL
jgi:glycosyltransferase involved in cell wall biosynthesis